MDLLQIRDQIDKIDKELLRLFEERMAICEDVAREKIKIGKEVFDAEREKQKIESFRGMATVERYKDGAAEVLQCIMDESKKLQVILIDEHNAK